MAKTSKTTNEAVWYSLAAARILVGLVFLWAFFDKLFGLGASTPAAKAWIVGGSPTAGFLSGVKGPFAPMFHSLAGSGWADWLFMLGLLGIGVGLLFGIAIRLSATFGSLLLFLMWMASLPIKTNPLIDDHLVYITILAAICYGLPFQKWSIGKWWQGLKPVKSNPWLQ
jgi:thiosulfate dehydrogenase (quinone) large subunit